MRIDRAAGEDVARPGELQEPQHRQHRLVAVADRVSIVDADRVRTMLPLDRDQAPADLRGGRGPRQLFPACTDAANRTSQAVGVVVDVLVRGPLRADVAAAEGIVPIAADREDLPSGRLDLEPADRVAQIADRVVSLPHARRRSGSAYYEATEGGKRFPSALTRRVALIGAHAGNPAGSCAPGRMQHVALNVESEE